MVAENLCNKRAFRCSFLGGFDIYERTGLEGYEIAAYVGAIIGAVVMIIVGITIALGIAKSRHS